MKLSDLDFIKLLPVFMREDEDIQALSEAMNHALRDSDNRLHTLSSWSSIDQLSDAELDELAYELDIDWYESGSARDIKIKQIKSAQLIKQRRGTKWALSQALKDVFGEAYIREWYEFDGEPFTFEVAIKDPITTQAEYSRMLMLIDKAKNARSRMVQAYLLSEYRINVAFDSVHHEGDFPVVMCGLKRCGQVPYENAREIERCGLLLCGHRAVSRPQIVSGLFVCGEENARIQ